MSAPEGGPIDFNQEFVILRDAAKALPEGGKAWFGAHDADQPMGVWECVETVGPVITNQVSGGRFRTMDQEAVFDHWTTTNPGLRDRLTQVRPTHNRMPHIVGVFLSKLTVPQLCSNFGRRAPDVGGLALVTAAFAEWAAHGVESFSGETSRAVSGILGQGLLLPENTFADPESPLLAALATITPEAAGFETTRRTASNFLGRTLIAYEVMGTQPSKFATDLVAVEKSKIVQAATRIDDIHLLLPEFWLRHGIAGQAIFREPTALDAAHKKIVGMDEGLAELLEPVPNLQAFLRAYVDNLLNSYAANEQRDQTKMRMIIDGTRNDTRSSVDLRKLIAISNGTIKDYNAALIAEGADPELQLPRLNFDDLRNVPDALARILYFTTLPNQPPAVLSRQADEDIMHIEIFEQLRRGLREAQLPPDRANLRFRYPHETDEGIGEMMTGIRKGATPTQVHTRLRRKQGQAYDAKRPGYGVVS